MTFFFLKLRDLFFVSVSISLRDEVSLTWQDIHISVLFFILFLRGSVTRCLNGADWQCLKQEKNTDIFIDSRDLHQCDHKDNFLLFLPTEPNAHHKLI